MTIDFLQRRPTSGLSERDLMHGYRFPAPVRVWMECACGGGISATMGDWDGIANAIRCHQELTIHVIWREAHGL